MDNEQIMRTIIKLRNLLRKQKEAMTEENELIKSLYELIDKTKQAKERKP